jgi:hypothetical protein
VLEKIVSVYQHPHGHSIMFQSHLIGRANTIYMMREKSHRSEEGLLLPASLWAGGRFLCSVGGHLIQTNPFTEAIRVIPDTIFKYHSNTFNDFRIGLEIAVKDHQGGTALTGESPATRYGKGSAGRGTPSGSRP